MFADRATIMIRSGKGGDGHVSFRRELYVPNGGPDGGDGGRGGDVIFEVDLGLNTLSEYRHKRKYAAQDGQEGGKRRCHGSDGADCILKVPEGTVIYEKSTGKVIADMSGDNKRQVILTGGRGGKGNMHYATATMQVPKYAQAGQPAKELEVRLELKVIADVGLVGFPNVGKSTFLSRVTNARPKIANYHFTTLNPNLGVVDLDGGGFVAIIDINNIKKYYLRDLDTGTNEKLQKYTDRIFDTSIRCIKQAFPSTIYYSQSDFIAFLITGKLPVSARKTLADTFSQIQHSLLSAVPFTISMGVGMYVDDIINIHNSYQQAKQVIQTVYQIQQFNRLFFYDQIGIYRLLFSISSNNEAIEFCDKYVKPLQQYDDQHHANLIETLQSIINCGWNLKLASEKLFLHYNSVKYRFQKICDLLEIDLRDNSRHTEIELALKIYLIQKNQI